MPLTLQKRILESRLWLLVIIIILAVGQIANNRQVDSFNHQVVIFHQGNVKNRKIQLRLEQVNLNKLVQINAKLALLQKEFRVDRSLDRKH